MLFQSFKRSAQIFSAFILIGGAQACLDQPTISQALVGESAFYVSVSNLLQSRSQTSNSSKQTVNLSLEKVASFPGTFESFTPDGQSLVTYEYDTEGGQTRIFDIDGTELASFTNTKITFAPNGQIMTLASPEEQQSSSNSDSDEDVEYTTRLMTSDGTDIMSFRGGWPQFVFNEPRIIIHNQVEDISHLYNFEGEEVTTLKGVFLGFTLGPQDLVTYSNTEAKYYLHDFDGTELASFRTSTAFPGNNFIPNGLQGWQPLPDGQRVFVSEGNQTRLFDRAGVEYGTYAGYGIGLSPDEQAIATYFAEENVSRLVNFEGEELASYQGFVMAFTPDGQQVITSSKGETYVYDLDGTELALLPGNFRQLMPDEGKIIATSPDGETTILHTLDGSETILYRGGAPQLLAKQEVLVTGSLFEQDTYQPQTYFYSIEGAELAVMPGTLGGISPDGEMIAVYSSEDSRTDIYRVSVRN